MTSILFEYHGLVNGSFVDCLDLLVWCIRHNIDINLIILNKTEKSDIFYDVINSVTQTHYTNYVKPVALSNKIQIVNDFSFIKNLDKTIIFDYTTLLSLNPFLTREKTIYISNILEQDLEKYGYTLDKINAQIFFDFYLNFKGDTLYSQKYLFDSLKYSYHPKENRKTLIICPGCKKNKLIENVYSGMYSSQFDFTSFNFIYRHNSELCTDLYDSIASVMYFQSPYVYDRKPRILMESIYLDIPVEYYPITTYHNVDGSSYIMKMYNTKEILKSKQYSVDDILIQWIVNE